MNNLELMKQDLRENHRIKDDCDYAITYKYGKYHLLCGHSWLDVLTGIGDRYGIHFTTACTYSP